MPDTIPFDQIEAVLFDLDGTLINTDDDAVARLAVRLRPLLGRRSPHSARWLMMKAETPGNALITLLDILHLDEALMSTTDKLRRRRGVYPAHEFSLIPGVGELLLSLQGRYKVALVTTRSRFHIEAFLQQFPVETAVFDATCGLQDTRRLKPHPAPVRLAAQRLGVPVEKCVMVGDTAVDVKSARHAEVWSIGVLCGFGERRELERAGAHLILDSTPDLFGHLMLEQ